MIDLPETVLQFGGGNFLRAFNQRALRALTRHDEERATLEVFLERYPSAVQAEQARKRLEELAR